MSLLSNINDLPEEMLEKFFTIGCEISEAELPNFYGIIPLQSKRHKKPFAETVSYVCRSWRYLVNLQSNSHLWMTRVYLRESDMTEANLVAFKDSLADSRGSDLDIFLTTTRDHMSNLPSGEPKAIPITMRLFMHGMRMIEPYYRQWRSIYATLDQPEAIALLFSILNDTTGPTSGFICLHISSQIYGISLEQILADSEVVGFHHLELQNYSLRPSHSLRELVVVSIYGASFLYGLIIPPRLRYLNIQASPGCTNKIDWTTITELMMQLSGLRSLSFDVDTIENAPKDTPSPRQMITLPELSDLSLRGNVATFALLLSTFVFPKLLMVKLCCAADVDSYHIPDD